MRPRRSTGFSRATTSRSSTSGHTHYNELANDGRTIFAATRSTGQIEEGPVGYSIATLDDGVVSWRFKALDDAFPFVIITAPADHRLLRNVAQAVSDECEVRALVVGRNVIPKVTCQTEDGAPVLMTQRPGERVWSARLTLPNDRLVTIVVQATDDSGRPGQHAIRAATPSYVPPAPPLGRQRCRIGRRLAGKRHPGHAARPQPQRATAFLTPAPSSTPPESDMSPNESIWLIAALATAGVILHPFDWPEAIWAVAGAGLLLALRLITPADAWAGIGKGTDVYLFLIGMMLLAEVAREEGLFDWLAAVATKRAKGSGTRLFLLIYVVGTVVTTFLSNDATAVVLTPAVAAAVKTAKAKDALPYLFICAFIANAASFVLPISNPANLVIYGSHMPPLLQWLPRYLLPSALAILATYAILRVTQRASLNQAIATDVPVPDLSGGGKTAALGIGATALVLLGSSAADIQLGLPTAIAGVATAVAVLARARKAPWTTLKGISWAVLPLVAGLFVLVEALDKSGLIRSISAVLHDASQSSATEAAWGAGVLLAFATNLMNNLPAGLIAGNAVQAAHVPDQVTRAVLIGVDLGPNLSVTGSLATILWLTALRREGQSVGAWAFLKLGILVMPPALVLAIGAAVLFN